MPFFFDMLFLGDYPRQKLLICLDKQLEMKTKIKTIKTPKKNWAFSTIWIANFIVTSALRARGRPTKRIFFKFKISAWNLLPWKILTVVRFNGDRQLEPWNCWNFEVIAGRELVRWKLEVSWNEVFVAENLVNLRKGLHLHKVIK